MLSFVLEIGTEELPARFLPGLEKELAERFSLRFEKEAVSVQALRVACTPRRAMVSATLAETAQTHEELIQGPPRKICYDAAGNATKAAEGFAATHGVAMEDLFVHSTGKGEYLAVKKHMGGGATADILRTACPEIITALTFPKRMHWGDGTFTYARPIRWILALLGDAVIPFSIAGVSSGSLTYGHRVHGPGPFEVPHASEYGAVISEKCRVTGDACKRRETICSGGDALARKIGGRVLWKSSLLDEVQGLCEHPVPLLGNFDSSFLEIPREVLLTSMEGHQKSFGVEDADGTLLPCFLTVLNITPSDEALVRKGWERVLRARLEDARFFWKTDLAACADEWLKSLDTVIFLAPLGSMGDKTRRLETLTAWLAEKTNTMPVADAARAGRLSKADLVSGMVGEFDTLQGIMGGIYARCRGENESVATALAEQYLPAGPDSPVPVSISGALLSMADKADTLAGCFGLGMIPTGTVDPYALRRCALGIARIILEHDLPLTVTELFHQAQRLYGDRAWKLAPGEALAKLDDFFSTRLKNLFITQGAPTLLVEAALAAGADDVREAAARLSALQTFSASQGFAPAVMTFKRVTNIVRKQEQESGVESCAVYDHALLQEEAEKKLALALDAMAPRFESLWAARDFASIFALLSEIRPVVDDFFEAVMVMSDDAALRQNRLALLKNLAQRFARLADFSALQM